MADYSYKSLCYRIPEHIEAKFKDDSGGEPDGDANYDGDYWTLADMYVDELIQQRDEVCEALERLLKASTMSVSHSEYVTVFDEVKSVLTKIKGGAA